MKKGTYYVRPTSQEARIQLINYLEEQGFKYIRRATRESTIESVFPVIVDVKKKTIDYMGNVTVSACAAGSNVLISEEEFYQRR